MSEIKLKPCPFCGGQPVLIDKDILGTWCKSVMCRDCKATVAYFVDESNRGEKRAANAWNRRADTDNDPNRP